VSELRILVLEWAEPSYISHHISFMFLLVFAPSVFRYIWRCSIYKEGCWSACQVLLTPQEQVRVEKAPRGGLPSFRQGKNGQTLPWCNFTCTVSDGCICKCTEPMDSWLWCTASSLATGYPSTDSTVGSRL